MPDTPAAGHPVAEIVTFRLAPGADTPRFLAAARATAAFLERTPGYLARRLSLGPDGRWTDWVGWADHGAAGAAAAALTADPVAAPFLSMIDAASIEMRHEALLWSDR